MWRRRQGLGYIPTRPQVSGFPYKGGGSHESAQKSSNSCRFKMEFSSCQALDVLMGLYFQLMASPDFENCSSNTVSCFSNLHVFLLLPAVAEVAAPSQEKPWPSWLSLCVWVTWPRVYLLSWNPGTAEIQEEVIVCSEKHRAANLPVLCFLPCLCL